MILFSKEKEITENDLPKYEQEKSMDEIFADLNNLVGLENIKQVLKDLVDLIELKNKTKDDLNGKKIGTQQGTTGYIYASDTPENGGYGEENVVGYDSGTVAVEALKSGKVDCVIIDNEPAKAYVAANTGLKILDTEFANEDYAICFSKKNPELQKKVNDALNELKASGEFQKVVDKYIKAN